MEYGRVRVYSLLGTAFTVNEPLDGVKMPRLQNGAGEGLLSRYESGRYNRRFLTLLNSNLCLLLKKEILRLRQSYSASESRAHIWQISIFRKNSEQFIWIYVIVRTKSRGGRPLFNKFYILVTQYFNVAVDICNSCKIFSVSPERPAAFPISF